MELRPEQAEAFLAGDRHDDGPLGRQGSRSAWKRRASGGGCEPVEDPRPKEDGLLAGFAELRQVSKLGYQLVPEAGLRLEFLQDELQGTDEAHGETIVHAGPAYQGRRRSTSPGCRFEDLPRSSTSWRGMTPDDGWQDGLVGVPTVGQMHRSPARGRVPGIAPARSREALESGRASGRWSTGCGRG